MALVHDVCCIFLPLLYTLSAPWEYGGRNTTNQLVVLDFCFGYYVADFIFWTTAYFSGFTNWPTIVHHTFCISGIVVSWLTGRSAADLSLGILVTHLPSPFGYTSFFLKELGGYDELVVSLKHHYVYVKIVANFLLSPIVIFNMLVSPETHVLIKVDALGLLVVNMHLLYQSVQQLLVQLRKQ